MIEDRLGRATLWHDGEATEANVLTRAIVMLNHEVAAEDGIAELGRPAAARQASFDLGDEELVIHHVVTSAGLHEGGHCAPSEPFLSIASS